MRSLASVLVVLLLTAVAHAQPGNTPPPPQPYPPQHQPYPAPPPGPPGPPPQYAPPYAPPVQLTSEEHELLARGEIPHGSYISGGIVSLFVGLGVGQAVQGRWTDTGWIFTLGEVASFTALIIGVAESCSETECNAQDDEAALIIGGLVGLVAFRVWEIVDVWSGPPRHNRRVRELRMRVGAPPPMYSRVAPYVDKPRHGSGSGGVVGLSLRF